VRGVIKEGQSRELPGKGGRRGGYERENRGCMRDAPGNEKKGSPLNLFAWPQGKRERERTGTTKRKKKEGHRTSLE